jgi:transposase-like protein
MLTSKKGILALQIHRMMGFGSYSTAHYMCYRIRAGLADPEFRKLMGIVEIDETYVGGRHWDKRTEGTGGEGKETVVGAVERKGNVVACVIEHADTTTLNSFIREAISEKASLIATRNLKKHKTVGLFSGQYVDGVVHTQTIDGFWSLLKRGTMGSFHKVSRKYLPLYVAEFELRYNNRNNPDIFGAAIALC